MTKKYSVTPFNKIENKAPANIVFTQGNATKVEADGPDNYIPQLIVMVKDLSLIHISFKPVSGKAGSEGTHFQI